MGKTKRKRSLEAYVHCGTGFFHSRVHGFLPKLILHFKFIRFTSDYYGIVYIDHFFQLLGMHMEFNLLVPLPLD